MQPGSTEYGYYVLKFKKEIVEQRVQVHEYDNKLSAIALAREKQTIVKSAISKYGLAGDTSRTGGTMGGYDVFPDKLYSQTAIYIAAAHALKPSYSVCIFYASRSGKIKKNTRMIFWMKFVKNGQIMWQTSFTGLEFYII